jgi:hypothetical protein
VEFSDLDRKGIWATPSTTPCIAADQGTNDEGPWGAAVSWRRPHATELVTVSLGANDMQFSGRRLLLKECLAKQFVSLNEALLGAARKKAEESGGRTSRP